MVSGEEEFVEDACMDQEKDECAAGAALERCSLQYHKRDMPASLVNVLLKTPIDDKTRFNASYCSLKDWPYLVLQYLDNHRVSVKNGSILLQKAVYTDHLSEILNKMLDTNQAREVWESLVLAIAKAEKPDQFNMRLGLRECSGRFNNESIECIHDIMKTRNPKNLAPRIAAVLPNNLSTMMHWMSLCKAQKTDVAAELLCNMTHEQGTQALDIEYYKSKLDAVREVEQESSGLVKSWIDIYQAFLHFEIGRIFWQRGNEAFKIGFVETVEEKEYVDSLEAWLDDPANKIVGKDDLLHKIRTDREPRGRRDDGYVWHIKLVKMLYESSMFKSVGVERTVGNKLVDILLEDVSGKDIHIEAWGGMTEVTHGMRRMFQTGEHFDINKIRRCGDGPKDAVFEWEHANEWLNNKVSQLPPTGRNFVVAQHPQHELIWKSMEGVNLKDNTCVIQIAYPNAIIGCGNYERMGTTARLISEALGCNYRPLKQ